MQRDLQFLLDMLQSAELIVSYTKHSSEAEFAEDIQLQDAVIRRILVIAEAAKRVSESTRQALPNIAWTEINGRRNRLVHGYDDINLSVVWNVVQAEIPPLITELTLHIPLEN
ncbi:HepT-like ribonuclease domain-containing protein [Nodosilinea sp. AN01ver1]|uniref:HepT-like ribonuclease domain-containing protein n=1 Tax=Nodosilinea sp. AN01ver1 TaxID=3423362 RepID=UPI003D32025B